MRSRLAIDRASTMHFIYRRAVGGGAAGATQIFSAFSKSATKLASAVRVRANRAR